MVEDVTLGTSQLVPPRSAGLLEKRIFENVPCREFPANVAIPARASAENVAC